MNTFLTIPLRSLVEQAANWRTIFEGLSSFKSNHSYTVKHRRLTLAPKPKKCLVNVVIANHNWDYKAHGALVLKSYLIWNNWAHIGGQECPFGNIGGSLSGAQVFKKTGIGGRCCVALSTKMLILTWEKVSLISLIWDCTLFPFNQLRKWGGLEAQGKWTSRGVESFVDLLSLGSSTTLEGMELTRKGSTAQLWGDWMQEDTEGDLFSSYSPTWVSTFLPDHREIMAFTFWTSLGSKEEDDPPLGSPPVDYEKPLLPIRHC